MQCPCIWTTGFVLVLHGIEECFTLLCKVVKQPTVQISRDAAETVRCTFDSNS